MKRLYTLLYAFFILSAAVGQVKPGIEVLRDDGFAALRGKRVGLITNPTGVDNSLRSTIDILNSAPGVKLTALFAPEHGVRGDHPAGAAVATTADPATGITVYSLHGSRTRPSAEMLRNVDVLVYDIQDIGARSYTFISTMGAAMEACADAGKEFMVLDRPNPLGGIKVEGPVIDEGCSSFVGRYPIPYLYGLTPGELAIYLNDEGLLIGGKKVKLTVIPMEGWERRMKFADTGKPVRRLAVISGAGGSLFAEAIAEGADCLLTGEANHHHALDAKRLGLSLIAAGHYATEFPVTAAVAAALRTALPEVEVLVSTENRDPYTYL